MRITLSLASIILLIGLYASDCSFGCLYCDKDDTTCLFCDIENKYTLEAKSCLKVNYDKCIKYTLDGVCVQCATSFYLHPLKYKCEAVPQGSLIENCDFYNSDVSCMYCKANFYISDGKCVSVPNPLKGCEIYKDGKPDTCLLCSGEYRLARDGKNCIPKISISNCMTYTDMQCEMCKDGYERSDNYYINDSLNLLNMTQRDALRSWLYNNYNFPLNKCKKQEIENCAEFSTFASCKKCKDRYYLDTASNKCVAYPLDGIPNCMEYERPTKCLTCKQGYFLANESTCSSVTALANCVEYDTKATTTVCILCSRTYKLVSSKCEIRSTVEIIENCDVHDKAEGKCTTCAQTYRVTDDKLKCMKTIENCNEYEYSNSYTNFSVCKFCADKYTYVPDATGANSGICQTGTVANCNIYQSNNICYQCDFGFSLQGTSCMQNNVVDNCKSYDRLKLHTCSECSPNYILFGLLNICLETVIIANCDEYKDQKHCKKCRNGYYIIPDPEDETRDKCESISPNLLCLQYNSINSKCTLCEKDFVNDNGICRRTNDYLSENCQSDNSDGLITFQDYVCTSCKEGFYFYNVDSQYICTSNTNVTTSNLNCAKYRRDEVDLTYKCMQCKPGYYLTVALSCETTCSDGYVPSLEEVEKKETDVADSIYDTYQVTGLRKCIVLPAYISSNCKLIAPSTFFQDLTTTTAYVCVQCKSGYLPVIQGRSTSRFSNVDASSLDGPFSTHASVSCVVASSNVKGTVNGTTKLVDNCRYYYKVSKGTDEMYGCLSCQFGFNGTIVTSDAASYYGYIDKCEDFGADCDKTAIFQGYSPDFQEINDWQIPLESLLTCHKCSDSTKKPVLFVDYENDRTASGYMTYTTSYANYYYFTTWNRHMIINPYSISTGTYASGTGGKMMSCITATTFTNFGISNSNNYRILTSNDVYTGCALLMVNIGRSPNASCSYFNNYSGDLRSCQTIYCAACTPGYKRSRNERTYLNNNSVYPFLSPYYTYACTAISFCSGTQWVNFCSACNTGYTWQYNTTKKAIDYDVCIPVTVANCQAAAADGSCVLCKKGFYLQDTGYCDKITTPFCLDNYSIQTRSYDAANQMIYNFMGTTGLYLHPQTRGCDVCQDGYTAYQQSGQRMMCLSSAFLQNFIAGSETNNYIFSSNCQFYSYDITTNSPICSVCKSGYTLTNRYSCVQADNLNNCLLSTETTVNGVTTYSCDTCQSDYIFLRSVCVTGTIPKCSRYTILKSATTQNCESCADKYYSRGDSCVLGNIANCLTYNSETDCAVCESGYYSVKLKNNVSLCLLIPTRLKCVDFDSDNFVSGDMSCVTCSKGFVAVPKTAQTPASYCFQFPIVENCIKYDSGTKFSTSTLVCTQCSLQFYLDKSTNTCIARTKIDPNCIYLILSEDRCNKCKNGYFLNTADSTCIKNPEGINNCRIYISATECKSCNTNTYLKDKACIEVPSSNRKSNCLYYEIDMSCITCLKGYILELGLCTAGNIANCEDYSTTQKCSVCAVGFTTKIDGDNITCAAKADENCDVYDKSNPSICLQCKTDYYPKDGLCTEVTQQIAKCIIYESAVKCALCHSDYALSIDGSSCDKTDFIDTYKDPNCMRNKVVSPAVCASCKPGYYFDDKGVCTACKVSDTKSCYICLPTDAETCVICASGYYMNKGKCVVNTNKNPDGGSGTDGGDTDDGSGVGIARVSLVILLGLIMYLK